MAHWLTPENKNHSSVVDGFAKQMQAFTIALSELKDIAGEVPSITEDADLKKDTTLYQWLHPYLASLPSVLACAGAIHKGVKDVVYERVKRAVTSDIAQLKNMYPNDYMTWALPGENRSM